MLNQNTSKTCRTPGLQHWLWTPLLDLNQSGYDQAEWINPQTKENYKVPFSQHSWTSSLVWTHVGGKYYYQMIRVFLFLFQKKTYPIMGERSSKYGHLATSHELHHSSVVFHSKVHVVMVNLQRDQQNLTCCIWSFHKHTSKQISIYKQLPVYNKSCLYLASLIKL